MVLIEASDSWIPKHAGEAVGPLAQNNGLSISVRVDNARTSGDLVWTS